MKRLPSWEFAPILYYVLQGIDNKMISKAMQLKEKTVKYRLGQLFKMYKVKNRMQLMAKFIVIPSNLRPRQITLKEVRQKSSSSDVLSVGLFNSWHVLTQCV